MINGMTVSRWACINFSRSVQENVARGFCSELARMCQVSGMVGCYFSPFMHYLIILVMSLAIVNMFFELCFSIWEELNLLF